MRALAHPLRLALLEALLVDAPLTATEAGRLVDESPTACSFHLRQLAKYGFVEEEGRGPGRERRWRLTHTGMRFSDVDDDPALRIAARALDRLLPERYLARLERWLATSDRYPREWRESAGPMERVVWVTPDEAREIGDAVLAACERFASRLHEPAARPARALPVELVAFLYPLRPPE